MSTMADYYQYIQCFLSVSFMIFAAITDLRTKKIPNKLVFPFAAGLFGLFLYGALVGLESEWYFKVGILVGVFILGAFRFMGMGDIKLLMVLALCFTPFSYLCGILLSCLMFVLFVFLRHPKETWDRIHRSLFAYLILKSKPALDNKTQSYPFAPFIAIGFSMIWIYQFIRR